MKALILGLILVSSNAFSQNDFWILKHNNKDEYGYVGKDGKTKIPFGKYLICFTDTFKTFAVVCSDKSGFVGINKSEKVLFKIFPFDNGPDYPCDGLFRIVKGDKIGFADTLGEVVILPRFAAALPFSDNLAAICENCTTKISGEHFSWEGGKWGFINKKGEIIIPPTFENVLESFKNGKAKVSINKNEFWIDMKGKRI
jgi:hypothetical protein